MNSTEELHEVASKHKRRLYVALLIFQCLIVFWPMFMTDLMSQGWIPTNMVFMGISQSLIVLGMIIANSLFVKGLIASKWGFYFIIIMNGINYILSFSTHTNPELMNNHMLFRNLNIVSALLILSTLFVTFYVAVKDIFRLKHDLTYSLLGAVNIFMLIGTIFSFIIMLVGSIFVGMIVPLDQMLILDIHSMKLAFYSLASMDPPYDVVNPIIRNLLVVESIVAHLFVVLIIGRLLSK